MTWKKLPASHEKSYQNVINKVTSMSWIKLRASHEKSYQNVMKQFLERCEKKSSSECLGNCWEDTGLKNKINKQWYHSRNGRIVFIWDKLVYVQVLTNCRFPLHNCAPGKNACPQARHAYLDDDVMSQSELTTVGKENIFTIFGCWTFFAGGLSGFVFTSTVSSTGLNDASPFSISAFLLWNEHIKTLKLKF